MQTGSLCAGTTRGASRACDLAIAASRSPTGVRWRPTRGPQWDDNDGRAPSTMPREVLICLRRNPVPKLPVLTVSRSRKSDTAPDHANPAATTPGRTVPAHIGVGSKALRLPVALRRCRTDSRHFGGPSYTTPVDATIDKPSHRQDAGWVMVASAVAPVLLVGGWTLAAALQSAGFDPALDTISDLAGSSAARSRCPPGCRGSAESEASRCGPGPIRDSTGSERTV
jgi:hypothetical protein